MNTSMNIYEHKLFSILNAWYFIERYISDHSMKSIYSLYHFILLLTETIFHEPRIVKQL